MNGHRVVLYLRENSTNYEFNTNIRTIDGIELPKNWTTKVIKWPRFWTQFGLSLEMFLHPVDALFIPAHTVPCIHPARNVSLFSLAIFIQKFLKTLGISTYYNQHSAAGGPTNTIVTIHGLEYEFCPEAYSFWERLYMRSTIKSSCRWAKKIIAVSENTKKDLMKLYKVQEEKIEVIYEGYENNNQQPVISNQKNTEKENSYELRVTSYGRYLLFVGRLEERKNVVGIIKSFEILKERYKIPHKLILVGKPGFGYEKIKNEIANVNCVKDIIETGFVSAEEKNYLLNNADVFVFPTLYEGFGLPILEAQNAGVPVVASNNSSIEEITSLPFSPQMRRDVPQGQRGYEKNERENLLFNSPPQLRRGELESAILIDPNNAEDIADAVYKILSDEKTKQDLIQKGLENIQRFSWEKCGKEIAEILKK